MAATTTTWSPNGNNGAEADGATVSVGNSGGVHGDAWDQVDIGTGAAIVYDSTAGRGAYSGRSAHLTAVGTGKARLYRTLASDTDNLSFSWFQYFASPFANTVATAVAVTKLQIFGTTNSVIGSVNIRTDGQLQLLDNTATVRKTFNVASHILRAGQLVRMIMQWKIGGPGVGKIAFGFIESPFGTDFTVTNAGFYEEATLADNGAIQAHAFSIGSNATSAKLDEYVSGLTVKTDFYGDIPAAAPGPPVATVMSTPASRGAGTVTVTGGITVPDGSVASLAARVLTTAQGAALATPVIANPPNNPTITSVTSGLGTTSATISATFPAVPGRYHVQIYGTKNDGTASNDNAWVVYDIYGASGQYEVKPFRVVSYTGLAINGATDPTVALSDGNLNTDLRVTGPANVDLVIEWCAFGPDSIEFRHIIDAAASPTTTAQVTVFLANGTTTVYAEPSPATNDSTTDPANWNHDTTVSSGGLAIATPGDARRALRTRLRLNQP
jgi:hypothetical protein